MGVSVTHEPPNPTGSSPENSGTPPAGSESTPPITPPTPSPPAGPTDQSAYIRLLEGTVAEKNRQLADAIQREAQTPAAPPKPPPDPDKERAEFYENPQGSTRKLIREELDASIGEIRDFVREFRGASATDQLINKFKADVRFQSQWDANVEQYVREQAAQMPPKNLNDNTFGFLVVSAIGLKATGMLQGTLNGGPTPPAAPPAPPAPTPTAATPPAHATVTTPPYMTPSPPAGPPNPNNQPKTRPLNENEQRLLREWNTANPTRKMNEEQYIKWQELPSSEVAFTEFDRPPAPKK